MLSAAMFAFEAAMNGADINAPALFYAGVVKGYMGKDVKDQVLECFQPDQEVADNLDELVEDIKKEDMGAAQALAKKFIGPVQQDFAPCLDKDKYPVLVAFEEHQEQVINAAAADPDKIGKIMNAIDLQKVMELKGQVIDLYYKKDYFGAGEIVGKVDGMVLKPWDPRNTMFLQ